MTTPPTPSPRITSLQYSSSLPPAPNQQTDPLDYLYWVIDNMAAFPNGAPPATPELLTLETMVKTLSQGFSSDQQIAFAKGLQIAATMVQSEEPQGTFLWGLSQEQYTILQHGLSTTQFPNGIDNTPTTFAPILQIAEKVMENFILYNIGTSQSQTDEGFLSILGSISSTTVLGLEAALTNLWNTDFSFQSQWKARPLNIQDCFAAFIKSCTSTSYLFPPSTAQL